MTKELIEDAVKACIPYEFELVPFYLDLVMVPQEVFSDLFVNPLVVVSFSYFNQSRKPFVSTRQLGVSYGVSYDSLVRSGNISKEDSLNPLPEFSFFDYIYIKNESTDCNFHVKLFAYEIRPKK